MASALDRVGEGSLVLGAGAGLAPGLNAAAVGNVAAEEAGVLVVDELNVVGTHDADAAAAAAATVLGALPVGASASGTRIDHELRPKMRTDNDISHSEAGVLSTVMELPASDEP